MLKGIDPLLTPELLKTLAEMGHGDEIVIADANFTATTLGRGKTVIRPARRRRAAHVRGGAVAAAAGRGGGQPVACMQVSDTPAGYRSALQRQVLQRLSDAGWAAPAQVEAVERFAFYDRVRSAPMPSC